MKKKCTKCRFYEILLQKHEIKKQGYGARSHILDWWWLSTLFLMMFKELNITLNIYAMA
jgi:hypothetical protein